MAGTRSSGDLYNRSVFINCPFDDDYRPLFEAIVWTVQDMGLLARCATERADAGEVRLQKIMDIIAGCKYGIHDISRADINSPDLPRFNMPYELGLFMGCVRYGNGRHKEKVTLILDSEKYRYQQFLSDIAGQDIKAHRNEPEQVVKAVWQCLTTWPDRTKQHGAAEIWKRYGQFQAQLPDLCDAAQLTPEELRGSFSDYIRLLNSFIIELDS